jgi:alpha-tubulin suppressor-like RCC1 family protein
VEPHIAPAEAIDLVAISCGMLHTAALTSSGDVICWGYEVYNQCSPPPGLENVVAICCSRLYTIAVTQEGRVVCWGNNTDSQCDVPNDVRVLPRTMILM